LIHAILAYSLDRLRASEKGETIAPRLALQQANALDFLRQCKSGEFDCIYLDPMFPIHKSGAKPGKEMQILQALTDNQNIEKCFELALARAGKRVIVKRPAKAGRLTELKPDLVYREKTIRFDVYLNTRVSHESC